jgi:trimeric autotransporter adhesin
MRARVLSIVLVAVSFLFVIACGGGGSSATSTTTTPAPATPAVTVVSPDHVAAGSTDMTLTVDGTGFASNSTVIFNGASKTTTFVSATRLAAVLQSADLTRQGVFSVSVSTPGAASASNTLQFRVGNGLPVITSLSPSAVVAGGTSSIPVTVNGSNFFADSSVLVDLAPRAATFVSNSVVRFSLSPTEVGVGHQFTIAVLNSGAGGGQSAPQTLTVNNPVPAVTSIDVNSMLAGAFSQVATITGSNFMTNSFVTVNGQSVGGTLIDTSHIRVTLGTANSNPIPFVNAGTVQIGVSSPAPGGGASATTLPFTFTPITPGFTFTNVAIDRSAQSVFTDPNITRAFPLSLVLNSDGRYLSFSVREGLFASREVPDILVRDLCTRAANCTPATFDEVTGLQQEISDVQPTGTYIAFNDLSVFTGGFTPPSHVEVRNTCAGAGPGCVPTSIIASSSDQGIANVGIASDPHITQNGRYISFISTDGTLANDGFDNISRTSDMFLRDTCISAPQSSACTPTTIRISVPLAPRTSTTGLQAFGGPLTPDARFVTFSSNAGDLVSGVPAGEFAYVRDTCIGVSVTCTASTQLVGSRPDGTIYDQSDVAAIDPSGRFVLFTFADTAAGSTGFALRDTCTGATGCSPSTTVLASAATPSGTDPISGVSASADLRFVTFTAPDGFVANDNNNLDDVFLMDTCTGVPVGCTQNTVRLSVNSDGVQAGGGPVTISRDGRTIAFFTFTRNGFVDRPILTVMQNPLP